MRVPNERAEVTPMSDEVAHPTRLEGTLEPELSRGLWIVKVLLAIPHFIVLFFVICAWWVTTVLAWFLILITGHYPQGLYDFGAAALRWLIRVEAYVLLMVDEYPPFSLR
jgi:hypothetical protein